ncbi:hypothetical protein [Rhodococcus sp. JVH1]|nr:hypothetical protein [Rhodococcus sp. JVH1]EJI95816.1 hypothetical protein JVH1_6837 [Rhodococcus sp. JVH1]
MLDTLLTALAKRALGLVDHLLTTRRTYELFDMSDDTGDEEDW